MSNYNDQVKKDDVPRQHMMRASLCQRLVPQHVSTPAANHDHDCRWVATRQHSELGRVEVEGGAVKSGAGVSDGALVGSSDTLQCTACRGAGRSGSGFGGARGGGRRLAGIIRLFGEAIRPVNRDACSWYDGRVTSTDLHFETINVHVILQVRTYAYSVLVHDTI